MYVANMYMDLILIIFVLDMYSIFGDRVGYVIILCIDILDDNQ
jgi:NADH:ubiquinone oxidoreductase subunit K